MSKMAVRTMPLMNVPACVHFAFVIGTHQQFAGNLQMIYGQSTVDPQVIYRESMGNYRKSMGNLQEIHGE